MRYVNPNGTRLDFHEFDYKAVNAFIYDESGARIRTTPAIHAVDGCVSFILQWKSLRFAFGGDTFSNKCWLKHSKDCDLAIHERFAPPSVLVEKQEMGRG